MRDLKRKADRWAFYHGDDLFLVTMTILMIVGLVLYGVWWWTNCAWVPLGKAPLVCLGSR